MMMRRDTRLLRLTLAAAWFAGAMGPGLALADSINPSSLSASGPTGFTVTVHKTVTINAGVPTTSLVDVFLLSDTTGSMGPTIANVRTSASAIAAAVNPLGDVALGVGEFKDKTTAGDAFDFKVDTPVTKNLTAIQNGVNSWVASGGGDLPEQALYALDQLAKKQPGNDAGGLAPGFRPGAKDVIVWFSDAPSHDPSGPTAVTEAQTTADLLAASDIVIGIDVGGADSTGQMSRIASATGGSKFTGLPPASDIATIVAGLITSAFANYHSVCLDTSEAPAEIGVTASPCITGTFDRSIDRTFGFDVSFTDLAPGSHVFDTFATVDGGRVAAERDAIISAGVPEPASLLLMAGGLMGLAALARKRT